MDDIEMIRLRCKLHALESFVITLAKGMQLMHPAFAEALRATKDEWSAAYRQIPTKGETAEEAEVIKAAFLEAWERLIGQALLPEA
jgi:hypothetical protein